MKQKFLEFNSKPQERKFVIFSCQSQSLKNSFIQIKKVFTIFLLVFLFGSISNNPLNASDTVREIEITKESHSGSSRVPSLYPASFNGLFLMGEITISAENYSGEILIQITGVNGSVTQTVPISETENAVIDVSSLPEGEYVLMLYTDKGTYTGDFVI